MAAEPQWDGEQGDSYDIERQEDDDEEVRSDICEMDQTEVEELVYSMLHPDQVDQEASVVDANETNRVSNDLGPYTAPTFKALHGGNRRRTGSTSAQAAEALADGWAPAQGWKRTSPAKQGHRRMQSGSAESHDNNLI